MRQIEDYKIIAGMDADMVAAKVKEHLKKGFEPVGGIGVGQSKSGAPVYAQGVAKYKSGGELN